MLALVVFIAGFSATAAWIIAPYLAWVSFAGLLNWRVVQLNKPFRRARRGRGEFSRRLSSERRDEWRTFFSMDAAIDAILALVASRRSG